MKPDLYDCPTPQDHAAEEREAEAAFLAHTETPPPPPPSPARRVARFLVQLELAHNTRLNEQPIAMRVSSIPPTMSRRPDDRVKSAMRRASITPVFMILMLM